MQIQPQEPSEAHPEIGNLTEAAASSISHPQDSPARGHCDPRGPQLAAGRGATAGQPFDFIGDPPDQRLRPYRAFSRRQLAAIYDGAAAPAPLETPPPSWVQIGIGVLAVLALWLFLFLLDGGQLADLTARLAR